MVRPELQVVSVRVFIVKHQNPIDLVYCYSLLLRQSHMLHRGSKILIRVSTEERRFLWFYNLRENVNLF